jgi:biopolymer transport protein TolQ
MNVTQDLSFLSLISNASVLVKLVMLILLGVSLTSWTYIFSKMFAIKKARAQTEIFERNFWSGGNLVELYQDATSNRRGRDKTGSMERIFEAGMSEYHKVKNANKASLDASAMLMVPAVRCAPRISAKWICWKRIYLSLLRSVQCRRTLVCSVPSGGL